MNSAIPDRGLVVSKAQPKPGRGRGSQALTNNPEPSPVWNANGSIQRIQRMANSFASRLSTLLRFSRAGALGLTALGAGAAVSYRLTAHADSTGTGTGAGGVPAPATTPGVYLWGDNTRGLIAGGPLAPAAVRTPTRVPHLDGERLRALAACPQFALAALSNGDVVEWTRPDERRIVLKSKDVRKLLIAPQSHAAVALAANGSVYTWQRPDTVTSASSKGAAGAVQQLRLEPKLGWFEKIEDVSCGADHVAVRTNKGRVYTGALTAQPEHSGELGIAAFPHFESLPPVGTLHLVKLLEAPVRSIACGAHHTLFLTTAGELFGCGSNAYGQLLLPYTLKNTKVSVPTRLPVPAAAAGPVGAVAAGANVSFFRPAAAEASWFAAGDGEYGQFGTGAFAQVQVSPVRLAALDAMREYDERAGRVVPLTVAAHGWRIGETHIFAQVENAARDWLVWGSNERGQLGNGKLSKIVKPLPLPSQIADYHALGATAFVAGDKISGCYTAA